MDTGQILLAAFFGWLIYEAIRSFLRRTPAKSPTKNKLVAQARSLKNLNARKHWPSGVAVAVVGEGCYTANIFRVAQNLFGEQANRNCIAFLVPEEGNKHDKNAVMVAIEGEHVGYLSRDDAVDFRLALKNAALGISVTSCYAHIGWGGVGAEGKRLNYSISLDVDWFET